MMDVVYLKMRPIPVLGNGHSLNPECIGLIIQDGRMTVEKSTFQPAREPRRGGCWWHSI